MRFNSSYLFYPSLWGVEKVLSLNERRRARLVIYRPLFVVFHEACYHLRVFVRVYDGVRVFSLVVFVEKNLFNV